MGEFMINRNIILLGLLLTASALTEQVNAMRAPLQPTPPTVKKIHPSRSSTETSATRSSVPPFQIQPPTGTAEAGFKRTSIRRLSKLTVPRSCLRKERKEAVLASPTNRTTFRIETDCTEEGFPSLLSLPVDIRTSSLEYDDDNISGEELNIDDLHIKRVRCNSKIVKRITIKAPQLLVLDLSGCENLQEIVLDAPNLMTLNLNECYNLSVRSFHAIANTCRAIEELIVELCSQLQLEDIQAFIDAHANTIPLMIVGYLPSIDEDDIEEYIGKKIIKEYEGNHERKWRLQYLTLKSYLKKKAALAADDEGERVLQPRFGRLILDKDKICFIEATTALNTVYGLLKKQADMSLLTLQANQSIETSEEKAAEIIDQIKNKNPNCKIIHVEYQGKIKLLVFRNDKQITILHDTLKELVLHDLKALEELTIDAPIEELDISGCTSLKKVSFYDFTFLKNIKVRGCRCELIDSIRAELEREHITTVTLIY